MQTVQLNIQLDVSRDILDKVEPFNPRDFFGVGNSSKSEIDSYLRESNSDWDSYIDER